MRAKSAIGQIARATPGAFTSVFFGLAFCFFRAAGIGREYYKKFALFAGAISHFLFMTFTYNGAALCLTFRGTMTPEELQRTIDFIIQQQAQFTADIQREREEREREHQERVREREEITRDQRRTDQAIHRMAEAIQTITQLLVVQSSRLDGQEERLDRQEEEQRMARKEHKETIARLDRILDRLLNKN